jgi:hypothetical protein
MKDRAASVLGCSLQEARVSKYGVQLRLVSMDGSTQIVEADHVVAATGYKADVHRFPFSESCNFRAATSYWENSAAVRELRIVCPGTVLRGACIDYNVWTRNAFRVWRRLHLSQDIKAGECGA